MSKDPHRKVTNGEAPAKAPLRRMGQIPVLLRVCWADGTQEWRAGTALRWTPTHAMVTWRDDHDVPRVERFGWFRGEDVLRQITWASALPNHEETATTSATTSAELAHL